ncbi:sensor histidine kinase [Nocardia transvalensis]|uniref:sensor histidine kinase n=1 Tax=Nocardia transvalensis TaxID=37333 RepID=UPI001894BEF2|nr:sensor histidine kinase [Nocardia transvalensis]MBF6332845.1 sensor domain-containing protein [Nocardia transvalensis]
MNCFRRLLSAIRYLLIGGVTSMLAILVVCGLPVVAALCLIGVGVPAVPEAIRLIRALAGFERRRAGRELGEPIVEAYRPSTGSLRRRVVTMLTDPATRRDTGWLILHAVTGVVAAAVAVGLPIDAVYKLVTSLLWQHIPAGAISNNGFAVNSWPRAALNVLIAIAVGALAVQLPRLARLQVLTARRLLSPATTALAELRQVVRSIYPPVLSDRGLEGAVSALAARCPIPCTVDLHNVGRRPAAVEAAAYFVIAEALANATKHSAADHISLAVTGSDRALSIVLRDDGVGGATEHPEGGLAGIRRRVEAFDGEMELTSPPGGPTVVRVELPCGS